MGWGLGDSGAVCYLHSGQFFTGHGVQFANGKLRLTDAVGLAEPSHELRGVAVVGHGVLLFVGEANLRQ